MFSQLVLFDRMDSRRHLFPLVATRPVGNLRVGIHTLEDKWKIIFNCIVSHWTVDHLKEKFPLNITISANVLVLSSNILPDTDLIDALLDLKVGECLLDQKGEWIASYARDLTVFGDLEGNWENVVVFNKELRRIRYPEDIFRFNADQIIFDLGYIKKQEKLEKAASSNHIVGDQLYIEKDANVQHAHLDSSFGPIYIASGAVVEGNVTIKGPVAICRNSRVKSGARIYPNVTIGDNSTVGGEISNTVIWGNAAKGHEGYLGCAVVGEGCNLGAGTTNSNLRNDWRNVKVYDYVCDDFRDTGLLKCGVIIGDQSMLGIQSKINTGTVIGVGVQVAISKFIPKFVPDFLWLTDTQIEAYRFEDFGMMLERKAAVKHEQDITSLDKKCYRWVFDDARELRNRIINTK
ncbi:putative sugar nucleotidyl transferase [Sphingobacterium lumbrici]|uniref:putative sugar nucleotidyl transferase n=1 Tax=Sphingobacterium lumbrici TaxID=2559600 RepID=UPI00112CEFC6|nr:putative sugar nucleotidyl transferase [Sphingobacterium lumbrici]